MININHIIYKIIIYIIKTFIKILTVRFFFFKEKKKIYLKL